MPTATEVNSTSLNPCANQPLNFSGPTHDRLARSRLRGHLADAEAAAANAGDDEARLAATKDMITLK